MIRTMILAALAVSLTGCGLVQQMEITKAKERYQVAKAQCIADSPGHYVARADCLTAAENAMLRPLTNDGDLLTLYQAKRMVTAIKVDQHEMTLEDARLDDAAAAVAARQGEIDRGNAASMVSAAQYQPGPILVPVPARHRH